MAISFDHAHGARHSVRSKQEQSSWLQDCRGIFSLSAEAKETLKDERIARNRCCESLSLLQVFAI